MPVPFRDAEELDALGAAGFLHFARGRDDSGVAGALLLVDARTEPLEFVHHWVALAGGPLWSADQCWRHSVRRIAIALFNACARTPALLLAREEEIPPGLLDRELQVALPTALVTSSSDLAAGVQVRWPAGAPTPLSPPARLFEHLATRDLLLEPFDRAEQVLQSLRAGIGSFDPGPTS